MIHQAPRLAELVGGTEGSVTLGALLDELEERAYGATYLLLAVPNLLPIPVPGSTTLFGAALVFVGLQELAGREAPWIPERVRAVSLSRAMLTRALERVDRHLPHPSPRWQMKPHAALTRLNAIAVVALGIVLALPVPFANALPALAICALGAGMLAEDARTIALGWVLALATAAVVGGLAGGLYGLGRLGRR
jgi:hypothetical protein